MSNFTPLQHSSFLTTMAAAEFSTDHPLPSHQSSVAEASKQGKSSDSNIDLNAYHFSSVVAKKASMNPSTPTSATGANSELRLPRPLTLSTLLVFTALCLSTFLVALDTVLIPTALPTIA